MEAARGVVLGFDVGRYSHHMTAIDAETGEVVASRGVEQGERDIRDAIGPYAGRRAAVVVDQPGDLSSLLFAVACVLSSLVEPPPSRICEPLPVAWRRMPNGIRHDKVSHPRHRNPSRSRQAPPPMRAWRTRQDSPLNCTSLPWWTTLSITAAAIWSSPKTLPQRLNSRLVVKTTDCRS